VADITVIYDIAHPIVHRVSVGRRRRVHYLLPWRLVQDYDDVVGLNVDGSRLSAYASPPSPTLEDRELLLARDLLDTQVVDLSGRLPRVSDVILVTGSDNRPKVAAVDVGPGSLLRRMGFRRVGDRFSPVLVDWSELHLTSPRGHVVQLAIAPTALHRLDASGLVERCHG
jgi:hypothetical protein